MSARAGNSESLLFPAVAPGDEIMRRSSPGGFGTWHPGECHKQSSSNVTRLSRGWQDIIYTAMLWLSMTEFTCQPLSFQNGKEFAFGIESPLNWH